MILLNYLFVAFMLFMGLPSFAQQVNMVTPIDVLSIHMKQNPRPTMILISTDWCKFCQLQKVQLTRNMAFLGAKDRLYYTELDAESKEDILFNGYVYKYKNSGTTRGIHELVIALAAKKEPITYPLWIVLDQNYNILFRRNGLLEPQEIKEIIKMLLYN